MTKPHPKLGQRTGSPTWAHDRHMLSQAARLSLVEALGYSEMPKQCASNASLHPAHKALFEAEGILGAYPGALLAFDNKPRLADYRYAFKRVRKTANHLRVSIER